jgi:hypothetical protein
MNQFHKRQTAYCTISTANHLYKASALFESLELHDNESDRICWCIDGNETSVLENGKVVHRKDFPSDTRISQLFQKYSSNKDQIRWSLKPIVMEHLLRIYDKVVYVDNDICFFSSPTFIWDRLDENDILLTPHHYSRNPEKDQNWLEANYKVGLYNAGFVAANKNAIQALQWWAGCCLYRCEKSWFRGLFDDQKYLDLMPIVHPNTKVLEHHGYNVAGWNVDVCKRTLDASGSVTINDKWPIVFIHFNGFSIRAILNGDDSLLQPHLEEYIDQLQRHRPSLRVEQLWNENTLWDRVKYRAWKLLNSLKGA